MLMEGVLLVLILGCFGPDFYIPVRYASVEAYTAPMMMMTFANKKNNWNVQDSSMSKLGKESTALDVLQVLNQSNKLAPYVTSSSSKDSDEEDDDSRTSRGVAVVTGGNSGIGAVTVETLALTGMKVILCCRNVEDGKKVVEGLSTAYARSNIRVQALDLSDLDSVESCVEDILQTEGRIDLLLNNAGVMAIPQRQTTAQNFEQQLGVNHIGHFFLTRLLLPHINRNGRIVNVASTAHAMGQLDISNLNYDPDISNRRYTPWGAYGQSKLANILFAKTLNDKLKQQQQQQDDDDGEEDNNNIISVSLHPGVIVTGLWKYSAPSFLNPFLSSVVANKSVDQGAATNVFTCLVDESELQGGGGYYSDCAIAQPNANGRNTKLADQLWTETENMITSAGYTLPPMSTSNKEEEEEEQSSLITQTS